MKKNKLSHFSTEKRSGKDRRQKNVLRYFLHGSRGRPRRTLDQNTGYYVDRYGRRSIALLVAIIVLSVTDAIFTLFLIRHGAAEINPVMAFFLSAGPVAFLLSKYILTCTSVLLLLVNKNVFLFKTKWRSKYLFIVIIALFLLVIIWEIFLVFQLRY